MLAGLIALLVSAAPAWAGPTVSVRIEGENATLLERTTVTLPDAPVPGCPPAARDTVAHAIEVATNGNWSRDDLVQMVLGETHDFSRSDYWGQWIDRGAGYVFGNGVCNDVMAAGDEALLLVDFAPPPDFVSTRFPLAIENLPATVQAGQPVTVAVVDFRPENGAPGTGVRAPVAGATVSGGGVSAITAADGTATLTFAAPGAVTLKAAKAGAVTSAGEPVTVSAAPAPGDPAPAPPTEAKDTTAPVAAFASGLADGKVFSRRGAPRELAGTVAADPSGLTSVRLNVTRRVGDRCWTFRGDSERFKRHRCGGRWYFRIGDRADWSYLLPRKLPKGRYTIGVMATDRAFNAARTEVEIRVA